MGGSNRSSSWSVAMRERTGSSPVPIATTGPMWSGRSRPWQKWTTVIQLPFDRFPTPGLRTIKALAEAHPDVAGPDRQIKTLVYVLDGEQVLVLLRGDHDLQEQKLLDATAAVEARAATPEEIRPLLGADPGSLGAVGVNGPRIIADEALRGRFNLVTGPTRTTGITPASISAVTSR